MLSVAGHSGRWPISKEIKGKFNKRTQVHGFFKKCWHIAQTRSHADRAFVRELIARKITVFIPLEQTQQTTVQSGGTTHLAQRMILDGYVFFHAPPKSETVQTVKESKHCFNILQFHGQAQYQLERDLHRIWLVLQDTQSTYVSGEEAGKSTGAIWQAIKPGVDCIITKGRLAGRHATVIDTDKRNHQVIVQFPITALGGAYTTRMPIAHVTCDLTPG